MIMKKYGYIRVSSKDQNGDRQRIQLRRFGIPNEHIYEDKQSGKDFNRPEYHRLASKITAGDLLAVTSIDRLGRNYEEILNQWRVLTKAFKVDIIVINMPLLDTRQTQGGLTGTFISDLVLQILSYVAETERVNIRSRQKEGIDATKRRGVKFGRPNIPIDEDLFFCL
ncbi:recombinase family protein [Eubacterium sp.]|uniref:recombinase family protein n=1 Tax=Eubacterium sp. TaxID=142586 RepID=UPI002FCC536E